MINQDLWHNQVTLFGKHIRLEPMTEEHIPALAGAGRDESIWRYMVYGDLTTKNGMRTWVMDMLSRQTTRTDLCFVVIHQSSNDLVGATRYLEMRPEHRSLEIGGTWYAPEYQRTVVNTECKYLLLKYAFEKLGCIRVQFKADARNERSVRAIERLGAQREGLLRKHYILPDGTIRDSVYFSILDKEWPDVKVRLEEILK
ncbi:MAG TPA: GNAT family protein [Anaerolineales bacterium]